MDVLVSSQNGYFTAAQAVHAGVSRAALTRAVKSRRIVRLDHGVYRVRYASHDEHQRIRVPYMRLDPLARPDTVMRCPRVWVAGKTAAEVYGYGVMTSPELAFCAARRIRPRNDRDRSRNHGFVRVTHVRGGIPSEDWTYRNGFALLSVERIAADLLEHHADEDHVGRFMKDAVRDGATTPERLAFRTGRSLDDIFGYISSLYR